MGNCDSSEKSHHSKNTSKLEISKNNDEYFSNLSSSSLPPTSSSYLNKKNNVNLLKKHYSTEKKYPLKKEQYLLPENIAKREDITKKYKLTNKIIGSGATCTVYLGENSSGEQFAIKRIPKVNIFTRQNAIMKESEICLKLNHKNIIKYYEIYEDINFINIIMELGDTDLFELIINSPSGVISGDLALDILSQIFEVIDYLHNVVNIIHCDIKPENFVIKFDKNNGNKPILKLVDFGNSRKKPKNNERVYHFCGTKEYMAPESFEKCGFNEKVDEWAAGVIMFNMLTGTDPFTGDNESDFKNNINFQKIQFENIKNESLRELNKKLLNRCINNRITSKEALEEIKQIKNKLKLNKVSIKSSLIEKRKYLDKISNELSKKNKVC